MSLDGRGWFKRAMDAQSQLWNARYLNGDPNECVSGRCYRRGVLEGSTGWNRARRVVDWLFSLVGESEHCRKAWIKDNRWAGRRLRMLRRRV